MTYSIHQLIFNIRRNTYYYYIDNSSNFFLKGTLVTYNIIDYNFIYFSLNIPKLCLKLIQLYK